MEKSLTVYPICSGDMLNIFAGDTFGNVRIMDMAGNLVLTDATNMSTQWQVDIQQLCNATYIIEVVYADSKTARSVFVKM